MKIYMAMAVIAISAIPAFGQTAEQPPTQSRQQQVIPQQLHPRVRAIPIPNWPAHKPAPVIPIPTKMQPEAGMVTRVPRFVPTMPAWPCTIEKNCQLLEGTSPNSVKQQKPTTEKAIGQAAPEPAAK